jgi:hypothetical protein
MKPTWYYTCALTVILLDLSELGVASCDTEGACMTWLLIWTDGPCANATEPSRMMRADVYIAHTVRSGKNCTVHKCRPLTQSIQLKRKTFNRQLHPRHHVYNCPTRHCHMFYCTARLWMSSVILNPIDPTLIATATKLDPSCVNLPRIIISFNLSEKQSLYLSSDKRLLKTQLSLEKSPDPKDTG